jgi:GTPase SAR1 family protein
MATNLSEKAHTAEATRLDTLDLLQQIQARAKAFELPEPPQALPFYQRKLAENRYQILVAGEAKRGKSSFVNALIGRDILPTDVDVATCQVFRIQAAEQESYRLRFEDESCREIGLEDLPRYGSQAEIDRQAASQTGEIIRWIEVDVPVRFLPKEISLLDTPGMGALYAAHAQITYRYVPQADAVIFVLDSEKPVVQQELDFIGKILDVTHSLFFIQTKIDLYGNQWEQIRQRDEVILKQHYGESLADIRIWPISSLLLRKAGSAQTPQTEDAYRMAARHKELAVALQAFLFRVAGWGRVVEAILTVDEYHAQSRQALAGRLLALTEESKQKRAGLQQDLMQRKQQFEQEWGEKGQRRREALEGIRDIISIAKQNFRQALQAGGGIETQQRETIQRLRSFNEMEVFQRQLGGNVGGMASKLWQETSHNATVKCFDRLSPLLTAAFSVQDTQSTLVAPCGYGGQDNIHAKKSWFNKLQAGYRGGFLASTLAGSATYAAVAAATVAAAPWVLLGGALCTVAAGVWGLITGAKQVKLQEQEKAKQQLAQELSAILSQVRQYFFDVDLDSVRYSRVDEFFRTLEQNLQEQIQSALKQKSADAQAEISRLTGQAKLDDQQRKEHAAELQKQLAEWDALGQRMDGIKQQLQALEETA